MIQHMNIDQLMPIMLEVIGSGGSFEFIPGGCSMLPTINGTTDRVCVIAPQKIRKHDIVLFCRDDGQYVLHRVARCSDERLSVIGDNQIWYEQIARSDVIATVESIKTNKHLITDMRSSGRAAAARRIYLRAVNFVARAKRKLLG